MKLKNVFLTLGLALGLGVSAVAGFSSTQNLEKADAATITGGTTLYLSPGPWNVDGATYKACFNKGASGEKTYSLSVVPTDVTIHKIELPSDVSYSDVTFLRMNAAGTTQWNNTNKLTWDGVNNLYTITGWGGGDGKWSSYTEPAEEVVPDLYLTGTINNWNPQDSAQKFKYENGEYSLTRTFSANAEIKVTNGSWAWDIGAGAFDSDKNLFTGTGTANLKIKAAGDYKITLPKDVYATKKGCTIEKVVITTTYTVNEYNVKDGVVDAEPFLTGERGENYQPEKNYIEGYLFGGFYTDEACTVLYKTPISAATNIYHKYTTVEIGYVYVGSLGYDTYNVYTFGMGTDNGDWPGRAVSMDEFGTGLTFNGNGLLRVPYVKNGGDNMFIINGTTTGGNKQTADLKLVENAYYDSTKLATTNYAGDIELGKQAMVAHEISQAINSATDNSICNIDAAIIEDLITSYDALEKTDVIDSSTIWTINHDKQEGDEDKVNYAMTDIVAQLRKLSTQSAGSNFFQRYSVNNSGSFIVIVIAATVVVSALGIYLIIKRRKNSK